MPAPDYYQDSAFLPLPGSRRVYLIPAGDTAYYIETNAGNGPGYGPIAYDIRSSDGTLLATHAMSDKPVIEPQGVDKYHWLIVRPADGAPKSIFNIFLKNT